MSFELEAAREELPRRLSYWQGQVDEVVGKGVELEVDPVGLPKDPSRLEHFTFTALGALRDALSDAAMKDPRFPSFFRQRVSKVLVRNDETAATSRFDFEVGRRLLVVITTPELRHWLDFLALQEFLQREL
jgi:hypothetical protein